jgi:hypothetical protein
MQTARALGDERHAACDALLDIARRQRRGIWRISPRDGNRPMIAAKASSCLRLGPITVTMRAASTVSDAVHGLDLAVGNVQITNLRSADRKIISYALNAAEIPSRTTGFSGFRRAGPAPAFRRHPPQPIGQSHHEIHVVLDQKYGHALLAQASQECRSSSPR